MATQIDTLREQFEQMNLAQKKAFIERLRVQLQGKSNPFLNECIQKYNTAARGGSPVSVPTAAAVPAAAISQPKNSPLIWIVVCLVVAALIGGGVFAFLSLNPTSDIVGKWVSADSDGLSHTSITFDKNGEFEYYYEFLGTSGTDTGTYRMEGNTVICKISDGGQINKFQIINDTLYLGDSKEYPFYKEKGSVASSSSKSDKSNATDELVDAYIEIFKSGLKDPSSLQVHEVRLRVNLGSIVEDEILIDYSARNGFGGTNREIAWITPRGIEFSSDDISGEQVKNIWKNKSTPYR